MSKGHLTEHFRTNRALITRDQARALGFSDSSIARLVASGEWVRVFRSVYRLAVIEATWEQTLLAACLAGGDDTVVSHRSAARLYGLDGEWDDSIEISSGKRLRLDGVRCHQAPIIARDRTLKRGLPVTSVEKTMIDLAAVTAGDQVEIALDSALRLRITTLARLRWNVGQGPRKGVKGIGTLVSLLKDRSSMSESALETRFLQILRQHSLPVPQSQYRVTEGTRVVGRFDFAYPNAKLIIEVDGYRWHSGRHAWQRDWKRNNALNRLGWTVLHFTAEDLKTPGQVAQEIREVLNPSLDTHVR